MNTSQKLTRALLMAFAVKVMTLFAFAADPGFGFPPTSEAGDQRAGSILIYNIYSSEASAPSRTNSRINITNISPYCVGIRLFFVDGSTCSVADSTLSLTGNQTASFLASDLDPGVTGYIVAVAASSRTGLPINFNALIGDEYVKLASGHSANLGAEAFPAIAADPIDEDESVPIATIKFDGEHYSRVPRVLSLSNIPDRASGNDSLLVLNRLGGNLATGASGIGNIFGLLYDDAENVFSFTFNSPTCQFRSSLSNNFPRTAPRFENIIPAGRSGWMKLFGASDVGLLGAIINANSQSGLTANAFNGGRNLHRISLLTNTTNLLFPVLPWQGCDDNCYAPRGCGRDPFDGNCYRYVVINNQLVKQFCFCLCP